MRIATTRWAVRVRVSVRVDQYVSPADLLTPPAPRKTTI